MIITNGEYSKKYKNFAEHPLSWFYFKYIEILIEKEVNKEAGHIEHLQDIAYAPYDSLSSKDIATIVEIVRSMQMLLGEAKDNHNEFLDEDKPLIN